MSSHTILCVDPGIREAGVAIFHGGQLATATLIRAYTESEHATAAAGMARAIYSWAFGSVFTVREVIVEWPQIYASRIRRGETKTDPNDLVALGGVVSAVAALFPSVPCVSVRPAEWKGQVPKEAWCARILQRLSEEEKRKIPSVGAKVHNVIDACGLGLWRLDRLQRARVVPR